MDFDIGVLGLSSNFLVEGVLALDEVPLRGLSKKKKITYKSLRGRHANFYATQKTTLSVFSRRDFLEKVNIKYVDNFKKNHIKTLKKDVEKTLVQENIDNVVFYNV